MCKETPGQERKVPAPDFKFPSTLMGVEPQTPSLMLGVGMWNGIADRFIREHLWEIEIGLPTCRSAGGSARCSTDIESRKHLSKLRILLAKMLRQQALQSPILCFKRDQLISGRLDLSGS